MLTFLFVLLAGCSSLKRKKIHTSAFLVFFFFFFHGSGFLVGGWILLAALGNFFNLWQDPHEMR
jgi:hypothetical protein